MKEDSWSVLNQPYIDLEIVGSKTVVFSLVREVSAAHALHWSWGLSSCCLFEFWYKVLQHRYKLDILQWKECKNAFFCEWFIRILLKHIFYTQKTREGTGKAFVAWGLYCEGTVTRCSSLEVSGLLFLCFHLGSARHIGMLKSQIPNQLPTGLQAFL